MSKRTIQIEVEIDDSNQDVMKAIKNRVKWTAVRTDFYKPSNYGPLEISMNIEATAPRNEEKKENPNWKDTKRYVGEETREEVACGKCLRKFIDGDKHICKTEDKLQGVTINGITYPHSSMLSDWAKFVAMDGDTGDWYEYSVKPEKDHPIWDCPVSKRTSALSHEAKTNEEQDMWEHSLLSVEELKRREKDIDYAYERENNPNWKEKNKSCACDLNGGCKCGSIEPYKKPHERWGNKAICMETGEAIRAMYGKPTLWVKPESSWQAQERQREIDEAIEKQRALAMRTEREWPRKNGEPLILACDETHYQWIDGEPLNHMPGFKLFHYGPGGEA